jgi:hypothetical protein
MLAAAPAPCCIEIRDIKAAYGPLGAGAHVAEVGSGDELSFAT